MPEAHPAFAHQYDSAEQQQSAATLGMWVFLITEIMFFGGLFLSYIVYRNLFHAAFAEAGHHLSIPLGAVNTVVLICSSLTMAMAVRASQLGKQKLLVVFLLLTISLGSIFLGIKMIEYHNKFVHHLVPGSSFLFEGPNAQGAQLFFSLYFVMTGLHALHMVVGVGVLAGLVFQASRGRYSAAYCTPVELSGLYWHFVEVVWIFLFPFLYLISRH